MNSESKIEPLEVIVEFVQYCHIFNSEDQENGKGFDVKRYEEVPLRIPYFDPMADLSFNNVYSFCYEHIFNDAIVNDPYGPGGYKFFGGPIIGLIDDSTLIRLIVTDRLLERLNFIQSISSSYFDKYPILKKVLSTFEDIIINNNFEIVELSSKAVAGRIHHSSGDGIDGPEIVDEKSMSHFIIDHKEDNYLEDKVGKNTMVVFTIFHLLQELDYFKFNGTFEEFKRHIAQLTQISLKTVNKQFLKKPDLFYSKLTNIQKDKVDDFLRDLNTKWETSIK